MGYMPELNVLCPIGDYSAQSDQPLMKHVVVEIKPSETKVNEQIKKYRGTRFDLNLLLLSFGAGAVMLLLFLFLRRQADNLKIHSERTRF
jgi:hypothetical protein